MSTSTRQAVGPQADHPPEAAGRQTVGPPLGNRGFFSLLATQFLGAANDNILKQVLTFMVATGIWSGSRQSGGLGDGGQSVVALCLTLPFILLSGYAGQIADRFSKRTVMVWVKLAEIPIAITAMVGLYYQNLWITLGALVLLAIQSSFFGPAKYGVVPELVADDQLSLANGLLNMLTNLAVILGSLAGGPLSEVYDPKPDNTFGFEQPNRLAPGIAMTAVAIAGLVSILFMPKLKAVGAKAKFDLHPFRVYFESLREMAQGPLLTIALAWSGFYMVGMMALLILPEYEQILGVGYTRTSYLIGMLGVSIAVGSVVTGLVSRHRIRPVLIPCGAVGMTLCFVMLGVLEPTYANVLTLISLAGFAAGFYIVPLQALMQHLSPPDERGRFLGTANALSFCLTSLGAIVYWVATAKVGMPANRVHLICAVLAATGSVAGIIQLRRIMAADAAAS